MQNLETENKSGETTTQEMADTAEAMQQEEQTEDNRVTSVSYTHLDVYKRQ